MRAVPSYLELHVHGVDGYVSAFAQSDVETIQKLIEQIHPGRLFTQPYLAVAGRRSLTVFPSRSVVRVDLVMADFPGWPFHFGIADAQELAEEEFRQRLPHAAPAPARPGELVAVFAEIELTNAERVFLELHVRQEPLTPVDLGMLLQQILSAPSQHFRRLGGGAIVINPAHILRMQFYPGPREAPPGAWTADPLGR